MGYALISYSTKNQLAADTVCSLLKSNGIRVWMAPADIPAGDRYGRIINQAIKKASCVILILTEDAQHSIWVPKELERAVSYGKTIIPLQLEDIILNDEFSLYISSYQFVPVQKIDEDSDAIQKLLLAAKRLCENDPDSEAQIHGIENENTAPASEKIKTSFAESAFQLGLHFAYGDGVKQDSKEAVKWYTAAAEQNHPAALDHLGSHCYHGVGTEQSFREAVKYYTLAAEQGWADAQYNLGLCYNNGRGVDRDYPQAIHWFRKAAEQGHAAAQFMLGRYYIKGRSVNPDPFEAVRWYKKAAAQKHCKALDHLGSYCYHGIGTDQNFQEAIKYYTLAAEQGWADSQYNLGLCLFFGKAAPPDHPAAFQWFLKAALQGHFEAVKMVVHCYTNGIGTEANVQQLNYWKKILEDLG